MLILLITILIFGLLLAASEYDWKGVLFFTILVGFVQDPIRKMSEIDSSYYGALTLTSFLLTFLLLKNKHSLWHVPYICWTNPKVINILPIFVYLVFLQAANSYFRFGDAVLSIAGILFYLLPLIALWVGFHIGTDQRLLRMFLTAYVIACSICAISILISLSGVNNDLLEEVAGTVQITGMEEQGKSGFWRTSEIAGWHLAAGACFSIILGITEEKGIQQYLYFLLAISLTLLSITTGRRKALGLVILFVCLFLLYYSLNVNGTRASRIYTALAFVALLSFSSYELFVNNTENVLDPYLDRSSTLTLESSQERFGSQGIQAFLRGLEISGPFGFGVGTGVTSGTSGIGKNRGAIQSLGYVVEGGGGRIVAELGGIGIAIFAYLLFNVCLLYFRNLKLASHYLPVNELLTLVGLLTFSFVNLVTFFTASQLYNDFFILVIIGLSLGTFLSVPILASKYQILKNSQSV